jgi:hypothetical protein
VDRAGRLLLLGREDVVVPGDLRVRKAVQAAYRLDHLPTQQEVLAIADKWRPYRSLATSYLFSATFTRAKTPPAAQHKTWRVPRPASSRRQRACLISRLLAAGRMHTGQAGDVTYRRTTSSPGRRHGCRPWCASARLAAPGRHSPGLASKAANTARCASPRQHCGWRNTTPCAATAALEPVPDGPVPVNCPTRPA